MGTDILDPGGDDGETDVAIFICALVGVAAVAGAAFLLGRRSGSSAGLAAKDILST